MPVQLVRSDRYAIHLTFAREDADALIAACRAAADGEAPTHAIAYDAAVAKGKRVAQLVPRTLVVRRDEDDAVDADGQQVVLLLSEHSLATAIEKLEEGRDTGAIASPEVCELRAGSRPDTNVLYVLVRDR